MLEKLRLALTEGIDAQLPQVNVMPVEMPVEMPVQNAVNLSVTGSKILAAVEATPSITIAQLAQALGINPRTVERNIKTLQENGRLHREGSTKSGIWRVL